jgi:NAD(P)-dependent dehydrogenase (short-subunit alcohol dehydrogenase family)
MVESMTSVSYDGKRVIVGGGGGFGMGSAVTRAVVDLGAEVHVLDLREPPVPVASFASTDLGDLDAITAAVERIGGPVHALFNCQGISGTAPGATGAVLLRVNFLGVRELTERVLPLIPRGGAVASVASIGGLNWHLRQTELDDFLATDDFDEGLQWAEQHDDLLEPAFPQAYAFSKEALILWTMRIAVSAICDGVRVNCSSPGATATPMMPDFPSDRVALIEHPIGRKADPEEQAWPLVFLNSSAASYVNGVNLVVDGGNTAARTTEVAHAV